VAPESSGGRCPEFCHAGTSRAAGEDRTRRLSDLARQLTAQEILVAAADYQGDALTQAAMATNRRLGASSRY
jgi:hypothetical protein